MIDLDERLRRAAELLDEAATSAPLTLEWLADDSGPGRRVHPVAPTPDNRASVLVRVAALLVGVAGLAGIAWAATRDGNSSRSAPVAQPSATTWAAAGSTGLAAPTAPATIAASHHSLPPAGLLPPVVDVSGQVPPTVVGDGPTDWYRLQPDLEVAWYSDAAGTASMLCLKTPVGTECQVDQFAPTANGGGPIAIRSVGDQFLVITLDPVDTLTVAFDNGLTATVPAYADAQIGWRVARVALPAGATRPDGMTALFTIPPPVSTAAPTTVPTTAARAVTTPPPTGPDTSAPASPGV
ncbi:MAG TPA: hypothetical protein VNQ73_07290 [Ilumatobacter sp.]|nr:hypothetical protein [Ilumatobacter sp.]